MNVIQKRNGKPFIIEIDGIHYKRMSDKPMIADKQKPDRIKRKKTPPKPKAVLHKAKIIYMGREMVIGEFKTAEEAELAELQAIEALENY